MTRTSAVAKAIARVTKAQAAYDSAEVNGSDLCGDLADAEWHACQKLEATPCASDVEFLGKLKYLSAREVSLFGSPFESRAEFASVARAAALHFGKSGDDAGAGRGKG